ncbi:glycosyltransferase family 2 protein [Altererythrobacter sp.]|uniref:glycosyltransferase family 2 protein n=1 Tax=Altererythrobacter sp. TaxID=1872480 RepID=UPI001B0307C4|nr:glycosyltransferase family 2 protein [Altererythrobacter sp.]MBO6608515.1 glycosyltransferase family 2 protein [Altererythrobacter sp.]MBO6641970.1 glycosyltransferase family 2 protein [Altererythrobacter sp.]MBO6709522.1 glycosyltransferase family 2 protein [Altererythrobacter sp.]MBO6944371.1 glycosyltransferase family 2 protein [Altererythrobacter sp.]
MSDLHFSVVIPAYNAAETLRSTVASVLSQTDQRFEIIIIDDGSTDDTPRVMLELAAVDYRIRAVSKPNCGVSATRNYGASLASGEWLAFLDADDQWHPEKLARHSELHSFNTLAGASFAQVEFAPEQNGKIKAGQTFSSVPTDYLGLKDVVVENAVCTTSNLVIRRDIFQALSGFDTDMRYAEDQDFLARAIDKGVLICGIHQALVRYRMSENGLSCNFDAMLENWRGFASTWLFDRELAQAEATYCRYLTRRVLRAGAPIDVAWSFMHRGLRADRKAYMADGARGFLTLGGVIAGGALPASLRRTVFA